MKRSAAVLLALSLTLGLVSPAAAIEVVPSGVMDFVFVHSSGPLFYDSFQKDKEFDRFEARQRSRIQVDFIANENLRGVVMLQFGAWQWGAEDGFYGPGAALDTTSGKPLVHRFYLDFNLPESSLNVKMGLLDLILPYATFGQTVFSNHVATLNATLGLSEQASLTAFWARPYRNGNAPKLQNNDMDVLGLWANLDFAQGSLAPWLAYANIGSNSGWWSREQVYGQANWQAEDSDWWGAGLALTLKPNDSLSIKFDGAYAALQNHSRKQGNQAPQGQGYYLALAVDYSLDWGTPGLFGIYSSGDKADNKGRINRMPALAYDDSIWPMRAAFGGAYTCTNHTYLSWDAIGLWMLGAQVANFSFFENVSHTARVAYFRGTNNIESDLVSGAAEVPNLGTMVPLTPHDQAVEVDLDTFWQVSDNLIVGLEMSYLYLDATSKNRSVDYDRRSVLSSNLIFRFAF